MFMSEVPLYHEAVGFSHPYGFGFGVGGLRFGVWGLGLRVWGVGFRV